MNRILIFQKLAVVIFLFLFNADVASAQCPPDFFPIYINDLFDPIISTTNATAKVELKDGDILTGRIELNDISSKTKIKLMKEGVENIKVKVSSIKRIILPDLKMKIFNDSSDIVLKPVDLAYPDRTRLLFLLHSDNLSLFAAPKYYLPPTHFGDYKTISDTVLVFSEPDFDYDYDFDEQGRFRYFVQKSDEKRAKKIFSDFRPSYKENALLYFKNEPTFIEEISSWPDKVTRSLVFDLVMKYNASYALE